VLRDPKSYRFTGTEAPLPMVMNGVVPALHGIVNDKFEGLFRLDVGSSSTVDLHTPFAKQHGIEKKLKDSRLVSGAGFGGEFTSALGRAKSMALGPYRWTDPMMSASRATEGAFASEEFAGNIGNRILERFRVTLDYDGRRVWLEPGVRYRDRDSFTRAGVLLVREGGRVEARSVLPGSPAERAGLREGDEVTSVDGRVVAAWKLRELEELFEHGPEGRRVALGVSRPAGPATLTMTLKEMLR
jgi:membrane-associated protease RseP (regulator of RpoE activity)